MEWRKISVNDNYEINVQGEIRHCPTLRNLTINKNVCLLYRNDKVKSFNLVDLLESHFSSEELLNNEHYVKIRYSDVEDLSGESWRDIPEWEGYYQASNLGRIKSIYREVVYTNGRKHRYYPMILKPKEDKDGYLEYCLNRDKKGYYRRGHRLVAMAFHPNPKNLPQVNHKDGDKKNNKVENLEWCTNLSNIQHSWDTGLRGEGVYRGEESNLSKLKNDQVLQIRQRYNKKTCNYKALSEEFEVSQSQISNIIKRVTWKHI